jgi:hypothetical protein
VLGVGLGVLLGIGCAILIVRMARDVGRNTLYGWGVAIGVLEPAPVKSVTGLRARMSRKEVLATLSIAQSLQATQGPRRPTDADGKERAWFELVGGEPRLGPPGSVRLLFRDDELVEVRYRPLRDQEAYFRIKGPDAPCALGSETGGDSGRTSVVTEELRDEAAPYFERVWRY